MGEKKSLQAAKNYATLFMPAATRPNPRPTSASSAGTFRFGRIPFGVFNHGDTMVHGDVWAYVDVFNEKGKPIGGGIAITAIPESRGRGPVWIFPTPDGDGPYLDGQAHTAVGRVWASARWANADRDAVIVETSTPAKGRAR